MRCSRLDNSVASEAGLLRRQNSFASLEHLCYSLASLNWKCGSNKESRLSLKLLPAALQKQDYILAAHVLVYGLVKASVKKPKNSQSAFGARKCYGSRRKRKAEG
jgi:hypothetical protein